MERSSLPGFVLPGLVTITLATFATGFAPSARAATPRICPQFLITYCVVTRAGHHETVATNHCLASQQHLRILHRGACERRHHES